MLSIKRRGYSMPSKADRAAGTGGKAYSMRWRQQRLAAGLCSMCTVWLLIALTFDRLVCAQPQPNAPSQRVDQAPAAFFRWPSWLSLGGKLELEGMHDTHIALGTMPHDARTMLIPEIALEADIVIHKRVQGFVELELSHEIFVNTPLDDEERTTSPTLKLKEIFVHFDELFGSAWSVRIGRQSFEDERQWLFDEELDAVRVLYSADRLQLDMALARQGLWATDFIKGTTEPSSSYYWLYGEYTVIKQLALASYTLMQQDHCAKTQLFFLGLRLHGDLLPALSYWLDVAHVRGEEDARPVRGWGLDAGLLYTLDVPLQPTILMSAAFGSGDTAPDDRHDTAFRQTGLHDNTAEFLGNVEVQYYGELLNPELSNLLIVTLGLGLRPHSDTSFMLMYHDYQQHKAAPTLRDARIAAEPTGRSRALGRELDLVGVWTVGKFEFKLALGVFWPGPAFADAVPQAFFVQGRLRLEFD